MLSLKKTNSITEVVFEDALKQARELDDHFKKTGELTGPLHGIPITLKDQYNIKGVDSTLGYVGRCFQPASEDAVLVQILKNMGAVIIAKTNLPQSIMVCEPLCFFAVCSKFRNHIYEDRADSYTKFSKCIVGRNREPSLGTHSKRPKPQIHFWRFDWRRSCITSVTWLYPWFWHGYWREYQDSSSCDWFIWFQT
jgi:hypothetical protein